MKGRGETGKKGDVGRGRERRKKKGEGEERHFKYLKFAKNGK